MVATLGEDAPSYSMVKTWAAKFIHGKESLESSARSERPVTVTTQEGRKDFIYGYMASDIW